jgi:hypothetical protein
MNGDSFEVPQGQRQLFIDDHGVASMENLTQTLHQPSKKGAVLRPALGEHAMQTRSAPHWDPEREEFRLLAQMRWYRSADGLHWAMVDGELQPEGSKPEVHALRDDADPDPKRRYKGLTSHVINVDTGNRVVHSSEQVDPEGKPWPGTRFERNLDFLVSDDGFNWQRLDAEVSSFDEHNLSYDPVEEQFLLSFKKTGTYGRAHMISTSPDFQHWSDPVMAIQADDLDQDLGRLHIEEFLRSSNVEYLKPFPNTPDWHWQNVDIYNAGVFRYEGIFLALPALYYAKGARWTSHTLRFTRIELWCSRDLHQWERVANRRAFIPWSPGNSGAYDLSKNLPPSYPLVRGDELWFYYSGRKEQSAFPEPDLDGAAVCLAVLRRDGFVSVDAGGDEGHLLTRPFVPPGSSLWVNADAGKGELKVEAVGEKDEVIAVAGPLEGDDRRLQIQWDEGDPTAGGTPIQLRFSLRHAALYSYWFE